MKNPYNPAPRAIPMMKCGTMAPRTAMYPSAHKSERNMINKKKPKEFQLHMYTTGNEDANAMRKTPV